MVLSDDQFGPVFGCCTNDTLYDALMIGVRQEDYPCRTRPGSTSSIQLKAHLTVAGASKGATRALTIPAVIANGTALKA